MSRFDSSRQWLSWARRRADLTGATVPDNWREVPRGTPRFLPDGTRPDEADETDETTDAPPQEVTDHDLP